VRVTFIHAEALVAIRRQLPPQPLSVKDLDPSLISSAVLTI
jgi:hypothetical protein